MGGFSIQLNSVSRVFGAFAALKDASFTVPAGQFVSILGPSGCGKTTLLRLIAGLDEPSAGTVVFESGERPPRGSVSYVFQEAQLLPWRDAAGNVRLPLELLKHSAPDAGPLSQEALRAVGLADFTSFYPAELSGGMKMRVSLARALVSKPKLLLLDEPFAALDEVTRSRLNEDLYRLWAQSGMTVVFVTHSLNDAVFLSQRILMISKDTRSVAADVPIDLTRSRTRSLRAEPEYLKKVHALYEAFERLGA